MPENQLTGELPRELGNLTNLTRLMLPDNSITGPIPGELGNLESLARLSLRDNELTGPIPDEFGRLRELIGANLASNRLTGSIPRTIVNLTGLDHITLAKNGLSSDDQSVIDFLAQVDEGWANSQTIAPANVHAITDGPTSIKVEWEPILYQSGDGYYQISYSDAPGGPYSVVGTTPDKSTSYYIVDSLPQDGHVLLCRARLHGGGLLSTRHLEQVLQRSMCHHQLANANAYRHAHAHDDSDTHTNQHPHVDTSFHAHTHRSCVYMA